MRYLPDIMIDPPLTVRPTLACEKGRGLNEKHPLIPGYVSIPSCLFLHFLGCFSWSDASDASPFPTNFWADPWEECRSWSDSATELHSGDRFLDLGQIRSKISKSEPNRKIFLFFTQASPKSCIVNGEKVRFSLLWYPAWRYQISAMPLDTGKLYVKFMNDKAGICGSVKNGEITPPNSNNFIGNLIINHQIVGIPPSFRQIWCCQPDMCIDAKFARACLWAMFGLKLSSSQCRSML